MKRLVIVLLLAVTMTVSAQEKQINLGLIPTPQWVELSQSEGMCVLAKAKVKEQQVKWSRGENSDSNWNQKYTIVIEPRKITICYEAEEGLQYARLTLAQLKQLHNSVPCCTIIDWPAYKYSPTASLTPTRSSTCSSSPTLRRRCASRSINI